MNEIEKILKLMDSRIEKFNKSLPKIERDLYKEIQLTLKRLDIDSSGNIKSTIKNLNLIQSIRAKIQRIMQSKEYLSEVIFFSNTIRDISKLSSDYLNTLTDFKQSKYLTELQRNSIQETRTALGIASKTTKNPEFTQRVVSRTMDIVEDNVKGGNSFVDLNEQVRDFILQDSEGKGALQRYSNQVTTDSLNQYNASYIKKSSEELGLEWFQYVGSLVKDSREWCRHMVDQRWVHESQLEEIIFQFPQSDVPIYHKTGLPQGMIAGTNGENILQRRGGWACRHQFFPVLEEFVPNNVKENLLENA